MFWVTSKIGENIYEGSRESNFALISRKIVLKMRVCVMGNGWIEGWETVSMNSVLSLDLNEHEEWHKM
jgi:hypothetical protein